MTDILDYIVIGGGIAGLYSNYNLSKNKNGILLEKESYFGGRVLETKFHGTMVKLGAGVVTEDNKRVLKLIKKLKIPISTFTSTLTSLLPKKFDMKEAVKKITKVYNKNKDKVTELNVEEFLIKYLGKEFTKEFIENCEYHDFLKSDVYYFIKYYKMKDMIHQKDTMYGIQWSNLVDKLLCKNCHNNMMVTKITKDNNIFKVYTNDMKNMEQSSYLTKEIIMAITLKPLDKLLKNLIDYSYHDYIGSVPFIRIYTYHKKKVVMKENVGGFNIVDSVLYKVIPYTDNIIMTSYADNKDAIKLKKLLDLSKKEQIKHVQKLLDKIDIITSGTTIDDILCYYWDEGVHYYKPFGNNGMNKTIKMLRNPIRGIKVVGEIVSKKQGYVEGAIESTWKSIALST
jgi:monoamine oxidase